MPKLTVTKEDGSPIVSFDAEAGLSLMENLRNQDVEGILAICGGLCACATCQVYLDDESFATLGAPGEVEADMIDVSGVGKPTSRLSCQINITDTTPDLRFSIAPVE